MDILQIDVSYYFIHLLDVFRCKTFYICVRYNHDKDNLIGAYLRDLNFILLHRLAYEMGNQKLYDLKKFILIRRSQLVNEIEIIKFRCKLLL